MGEGGAIDGQRIKRFGMTRKIAQTLDRAISEWAASKSITPETEQRMKQPYLPRKFYLFLAWTLVIRRALKTRVLGQLRKAVLPAILLLLGASAALALETGALAPAFSVQAGAQTAEDIRAALEPPPSLTAPWARLKLVRP